MAGGGGTRREEGGDSLRALGALWGKSAERAGGRKNLLLEHLLDTAAVAERMWDGFLAPGTRAWVDGVAGGAGGARALRLALWRSRHRKGDSRVSADVAGRSSCSSRGGLVWHEQTLAGCKQKWRHDRAGAYVLRPLLTGGLGGGARRVGVAADRRAPRDLSRRGGSAEAGPRPARGR